MLPRRRFLVWTATGLALVAGGGLAVARSGAYPAPPPEPLRVLAPWHFAVVEAMGRRLTFPEVAAVGSYVDAMLAELPDADRRDVLRLIGFVEHGAPLLAGRVARFTALGPDAQDAVLRAVEQSPSGMLRGGFGILKSLAYLALYREPRTWAALGYGGPVVFRSRR